MKHDKTLDEIVALADGQGCKRHPNGTLVCTATHQQPDGLNAVTVHKTQPGAPGAHYHITTDAPLPARDATCHTYADPRPAPQWAPSVSHYSTHCQTTTSTQESCGSCSSTREF